MRLPYPDCQQMVERVIDGVTVYVLDQPHYDICALEMQSVVFITTAVVLTCAAIAIALMLIAKKGYI